MKTVIVTLLSLLLVGVSSGAVVTNAYVQNKAVNWSHVAGVTASQSSLQAGGVASRAIDGNYSGVFNNGTVTHTDNAEANGWWQVDLGTPRPITDITLFNRSDCCASRLSNYSVLAGNDPSFTTTLYDSGNQPSAAGPSITFSGIGVTAQYVRVQRNFNSLDAGNNAISLAEVDVLGAPLFGFPNLASGSSATQSSTLAHSASPGASKAIDGNLANAFTSGSTTHTNPGAGGAVYWETTLPTVSGINEIALYNRGDCCPDRLSNFRLSVFDGTTEVWGQDFFTVPGTAAPGIFSIQEDTGGYVAIGDRVRIELIGGFNFAASGTDVLSLREVEIYGTDSPDTAPFAITAIDHAPGAESVTLTWTSRPGASYVAKFSTDMTDWSADIGDSLTSAIDENPDDGDHITETFSLSLTGLTDPQTLFFRIEEE